MRRMDPVKKDMITLHEQYIDKRLDLNWLFTFLKLFNKNLSLDRVMILPSIIFLSLASVILYITGFDIHHNTFSLIASLIIICYIAIYGLIFGLPISLVIRLYKPKILEFSEKMFRLGTFIVIIGFYLPVNVFLLFDPDILNFIGLGNYSFSVQLVILGLTYIIAILIIYPSYYWNWILFYSSEKKKLGPYEKKSHDEQINNEQINGDIKKNSAIQKIIDYDEEEVTKNFLKKLVILEDKNIEAYIVSYNTSEIIFTLKGTIIAWIIILLLYVFFNVLKIFNYSGISLENPLVILFLFLFLISIFMLNIVSYIRIFYLKRKSLKVNLEIYSIYETDIEVAIENERKYSIKKDNYSVTERDELIYLSNKIKLTLDTNHEITINNTRIPLILTFDRLRKDQILPKKIRIHLLNETS